MNSRYLSAYYFICLTLFLMFVVSDSPVYAQEIIKNYHSHIVIETDGSLIVTEEITVVAEGKEIKRGIYRDFPTQYKDIYGNYYHVKFELLAVMRDGQDEDYHTESIQNGIRIYIGNKNNFLKHGSHKFTLQYYTNRQLGFFDTFDELYWNITGNGWAFPIEYASATIQLPPNISIHQIETEAFTGAAGEKGQNFVVSTPDDHSVLFATSKPLPLHHGISVVVDWPKGFVKEPDLKTKLQWFFADNQATFMGAVGLIILWTYLVLSWLKVGKDPKQGIIYPQYKPDKQHSPASMRFVQRMGYDNKTFSSALVNMAVKGYLTITMKRKYFTIEKIAQSAQLSLGESAIARSLFKKKDQIILKQTEHSTISKTISAHKKALERDYEKKYFTTNNRFLFPGWFISIIILAVTIFFIESVDARALTVFFSIWLSFWSIGVAFLSISAFKAWKAAHNILTFVGALFSTLFAIPFLAGEAIGLFLFWQNAGAGVLLIFILTIVTNILFYQWMKAPTLKGRKLLDQVDGFKYYLTVAEAEEMQYTHSPEQTPELTPALFEKYLPYAMALDVEQQWSQKFNTIFSQLEQQGQPHSPQWYSGKHWNTHNLSGFSSAMGSTLSSAVSSSSTAPGSSSGSGGGGSSGGGGGGGGGGGW